MIRILFVCHGNICRSPLAEYLFRDMVNKAGRGKEFMIASAATSDEELGNPVHRGTKEVLSRLGISCYGKTARQMTRSDYNEYDYIIGMDEANRKNIMRIAGGDPKRKISCLMDYTDNPRSVADPWYTRDFERTYSDIKEGCEALMQQI